MNNKNWIDHLSSWKCFLKMLIDSTEDDGQRIKYSRQIKTIEKVQCGAVLNPFLLSDFIEPIEEVIPDFTCDNYFFELNDAQKKAVNTSLGAKYLSIIQGPPRYWENSSYCRDMFTIIKDIS